MSSDTSVLRAPALRITVLDEAPARLPGQEGARSESYRLTARTGGEYLFVGVCGTGAPPPERLPDIALAPGDICFYDAGHP
ncbi:MAG TPA: hypothetical protein VF163_09895, partial [Micromonosporaceae bacterium]